ncbi:GvpL/GvpF family gas vesicle protein [Streptomyces sp. NPDC059063]|uniref:GvpL/GvpF family gas vesicle protein n=1 Tax=unclassified Streptomyces TaxID=2593676 RepID=UPI0036AD769E
MTDELRYVYAVCHPLAVPLRPDLTGVAGAPPRQLAHDGLVAVVSPVPERDFAHEALRAHLEDLDWLAATARAHQSVVAALAAVTCPLPLRLATVFRDDSGVRAMLADESARLRRILDRIDGHVEWGVKVWLGDDGARRNGARDSGATESGRAYLRRRQAQASAREESAERAEEFARRLHGDLAAYVTDSRIHPVQSPALTDPAWGRNILNGAYLVRRTRAEEFLELLARSRSTECAQEGLRVEVTGPWAAYSFTDDTGADDTGADDMGRRDTDGPS